MSQRDAFMRDFAVDQPRCSPVVALLALVTCSRPDADPAGDAAADAEPPPRDLESASATEHAIDPDEALLQAARALADASPNRPPAPEYELRVDLEQLKRRRRQENPSPSPGWPEPAPTWEPVLELPGPQFPRDLLWYPENMPGACEIETWRWPEKSGPHDDTPYTRVFVTEWAHDQPSVLWVDRLDDGVVDYEVRAHWLTPSRLAAIEQRARRETLGQRWEYGSHGELLGGWTVTQSRDGLQERNDFLIDYEYDDEGARPIQVRHYDYTGDLFVLERVTWDQHPLRHDDYRPRSADPSVYALDSSITYSWQEGWLRTEVRNSRISIYTETTTGLQSVLHVIRIGGHEHIMEVRDGGRMVFEHSKPATRFERRQTHVLDGRESLPVTREQRELPGDWRVEERWDRTPDRVEHSQGKKLVTVAFLDCNGRPRPERLRF
jgi:hypothetical protein